MNNYQEYIDINKRKGFPRSYWFNQVIRWFTIVFSTLAIVYGGWLIVNKINADSSTFTKVVPFLVIFFALNSLLRNLFTINRLIFWSEGIGFTYLLKKNVFIRWHDILSIKLIKARQRILDIRYTAKDGEVKVHELTLAFPKMLEILNAIIEMVPQAELDDFVSSVAVSEGEKQKQGDSTGSRET
jgi:ABC-type multidrug transport system fused ATPase/permease subunit